MRSPAEVSALAHAEALACAGAVRGTVESVTRTIVLKATVPDEQLAYAEVYAPNEIDAHGEFMSAETVRTLAHRFLVKKLNSQIDLMHNQIADGRAVVVESFVSESGDPRGFTAGAWVLGLKINDAQLWRAVKSGQITGLSMQAQVYKFPRLVEVGDDGRITRVIDAHPGTGWRSAA